MNTIQRSVQVGTPVRTVYRCWTQFETFPQFMEGVDEVIRQTRTRTRWKTSIGGVVSQFDTEITELHPDERVVWESLNGSAHGGVVDFQPVEEFATRVYLELEYEPECLSGQVGAALSALGGQIQRDMDRFRQFVERGVATRPPAPLIVPTW